jgi:hypothetical protein
VNGQIGLLVPFKIQRPHLYTRFDRRFEDARQDFLAIPSGEARDSYLQGDYVGAHGLPLLARGVELFAGLETSVWNDIRLQPTSPTWNN